jgi:hypothetical protein
MSRIVLVEGAAPSTPPTSSVSFYVKTDKVPYMKDDAGQEWQVLVGGRGTALPTAPSFPAYFWFDNGAGVPDDLYFSAKKTDDTWDWIGPFQTAP